MAEVLRSTVMVQDGTHRLVHLVRNRDGLYTLAVERMPSGHGGAAAFEVDLTQAVLWAAQWEAFHNTEHWATIRARIEDALHALAAEGKPIPAHFRTEQRDAPLDSVEQKWLALKEEVRLLGEKLQGLHELHFSLDAKVDANTNPPLSAGLDLDDLDAMIERIDRRNEEGR